MDIISTKGIQETFERMGLIPSFLDESDRRPAKEQFDEHYQGGWRPQEGFKLKGEVATFSGDPPFRAYAMIIFHDEMILFFDYAYVAILQPDGSFEMARMN